jgi:hypothetical protein
MVAVFELLPSALLASNANVLSASVNISRVRYLQLRRVCQGLDGFVRGCEMGRRVRITLALAAYAVVFYEACAIFVTGRL